MILHDADTFIGTTQEKGKRLHICAGMASCTIENGELILKRIPWFLKITTVVNKVECINHRNQ